MRIVSSPFGIGASLGGQRKLRTLESDLQHETASLGLLQSTNSFATNITAREIHNFDRSSVYAVTYLLYSISMSVPPRDVGVRRQTVGSTL